MSTSEYAPCSFLLPVNISVGEGKKTTASTFYHPPELYGSERAVDGIGLNAMGHCVKATSTAATETTILGGKSIWTSCTRC